MLESKSIIKLSEIPIGKPVDIGGVEYIFKGYEKRKTEFGKVEQFIFQTEPRKKDGKIFEKVFGRFKFSTTKITLIKSGKNEKYKW